MKRIAKLVEDCHKKIGEDICISVNVWRFKHDPSRTEVEWKFWDGEDIFNFKTFQELTDYVVLERGV